MGNTVFDQSIDKACVEIIACTNGTDCLCLSNSILLTDTPLSPQLQWLCTSGTDEVLTIKRYLRTIETIGIRLVEHHLKIFLAASDHISQLQVLKDIRRNLHHLTGMRGTEIHVIIQDSTPIMGIFQKGEYLWTNHRIHRIKRAEHYDIISLNIREVEVEPIVRMILIEDILRIVLLIQESQWDRGLRLRKDTHTTGIHMIVFQETDNSLSHPIVTRLTDKCRIHANTPQWDQTVEHRTAWNSTYRLFVFENDVENRFTYTNYLTHND